MSHDVDWSNPYADRTGDWYKGNLHTHVSEGSGCASMSFKEAADAYLAEGFDFISVTDHFVLTELADERIVQILGMEWTGMDGRHTGIHALKPELIEQVRRTAEQADALNDLADKVAFTVVNHPRWKRKGIIQYDYPVLDAVGPFDAMEIYNFAGEASHGVAEVTESWDYLLTQDRRVLAVAGDDAHRLARVGTAWIGVRAAEKTAESIFEAIRRGNMYASSGVTITDVRREGDRVTVESENGQEVRAVCSDSRVLAIREGPSLTFDLSDIEVERPMYVRFEVFGSGSCKAWTQPFFLGG